MGSHTFDSYNAMIDLFGSPPLLVNGTMLTLEHVMQRLEFIENKVASTELIENFDKKIHNQITQYGSKVGMTLKNIKEKEPIVNEKINLDSTRIDKLEGIITNLGTAFSSIQNTPSSSTKNPKLICVPKSKDESSSKETADLKSISVHPNLFTIIKEPFAIDEFFNLLPENLTITRKKEKSKGGRCLIEELSTKDGNT